MIDLTATPSELAYEINADLADAGDADSNFDVLAAYKRAQSFAYDAALACLDAGDDGMYNYYTDLCKALARY